MTTKQKRDRRARINARIREVEERWRLSATRPERRAFHDLVTLAADLLAKYGELTLEDFIDAHRAEHRLTGMKLKVAVAEVEQYHRDVMQRLRDERAMLVYPLTEAGFNGTAPDVNHAIPGMGRGQSTYGWRIATVLNDPYYIAYWTMRLGSSKGGVAKAWQSTQAAIASGVLPALPPDTVDVPRLN